MYEIHVDERLCKGCNFCVDICPRKVLRGSERYSPKGYLVAEAGRPEACTGCMLCERICPDFAIAVLKLGEGEAKPAS